MFGLSLLINVCIAGDWTERYTPTRAEWLQEKITSTIESDTNRLGRIALKVIVFAEDKTVVTSIAPVDGQPELTEKMCDYYKYKAEFIAKLTLEKYSWSTSGKIQSRCV